MLAERKHVSEIEQLLKEIDFKSIPSCDMSANAK